MEDNIKRDTQGKLCEGVKDSSSSGLGQLEGPLEKRCWVCWYQKGDLLTRRRIINFSRTLLREHSYFITYLSDFNKIFVFWFNSTYWQGSSLSRIHDHTQDIPHSVGLLCMADQPVAETENTRYSQDTNSHARGGIRTRNPRKPTAADPFPR